MRASNTPEHQKYNIRCRTGRVHPDSIERKGKMEYKIVKIGHDNKRVESYYSKKNDARAIFNAWQVGFTDLDGDEIIGIKWYSIDDGKEQFIKGRFKAR